MADYNEYEPCKHETCEGEKCTKCNQSVRFYCNSCGWFIPNDKQTDADYQALGFMGTNPRCPQCNKLCWEIVSHYYTNHQKEWGKQWHVDYRQLILIGMGLPPSLPKKRGRKPKIIEVETECESVSMQNSAPIVLKQNVADQNVVQAEESISQ